MQTTEKSKIFLALLFLVVLLFVSCSFEDTLGINGRNTGENNTNTAGGSTVVGNCGSLGENGVSNSSEGSFIPKIYMGRYSRKDDTGIASWVNAGNDSNGDYISVRGGTKEYIKNFEYLGQNTWRHVYGSGNGKHRVTERHAFKFEQNKRILVSIYIDVDPDQTLSNHYVYIHDKDINK